jgi:hypothetical protein
MVDVTHFSIYFLHDFVFTLAWNLEKIENFLIFLRSRRKRNQKIYNFVSFFLTFIYFLFLFLFIFLRDLRKIRKFSIFAKFPASVNTKSSGSCRKKSELHLPFQPSYVDMWTLRLMNN